MLCPMMECGILRREQAGERGGGERRRGGGGRGGTHPLSRDGDGDG